MRYFIMKQDHNLTYSFKLRDFQMTGPHYTFYKEDAKRVKDISFLYVEGKGDEAYGDFIQNPLYMIAEKIQGVFDMYEDDLIFKKVVLINKEAQKQNVYFHVITDHIEVLSDKSLFYPDGKAKKIILDHNKIGIHHIFQNKELKEDYLFVSLEVVESLLRRKVQGILFEEVEVI